MIGRRLYRVSDKRKEVLQRVGGKKGIPGRRGADLRGEKLEGVRN